MPSSFTRTATDLASGVDAADTWAVRDFAYGTDSAVATTLLTGRRTFTLSADTLQMLRRLSSRATLYVAEIQNFTGGSATPSVNTNTIVSILYSVSTAGEYQAFSEHVDATSPAQMTEPR